MLIPYPYAVTFPLTVSDVAKSFGGRVALDGVTLDLHESEILGLLSPTGAGKSTLARTIMGRVRSDRGEVRIFGKGALPGDSERWREWSRRRSSCIRC